jgi:hypothetical protein
VLPVPGSAPLQPACGPAYPQAPACPAHLPPAFQYGPGSVDYSKADPYTCGSTSVLAPTNATSAARGPRPEGVFKRRTPIASLPIPNVPERAPLQTSVNPAFAPAGTPLPGIYARGEPIPMVTQAPAP